MFAPEFSCFLQVTCLKAEQPLSRDNRRASRSCPYHRRYGEPTGTLGVYAGSLVLRFSFSPQQLSKLDFRPHTTASGGNE
jgi:hypothetical protein